MNNVDVVKYMADIQAANREADKPLTALINPEAMKIAEDYKKAAHENYAKRKAMEAELAAARAKAAQLAPPPKPAMSTTTKLMIGGAVVAAGVGTYMLVKGD